MPDSCAIATDASAARKASAAVPSTGALSLAVVLDQRTMLVFGWMPSAPPHAASVTFGEGAARGSWRATSWMASTGEETPVHRFLAVLQAENIVRAQTLPLVLEPEVDEPPIILPEIARIELDADPLMAPLREAGADLVTIFDFLKAVLAPSAPQPPSPRLREFLLAFLGAISVHDGFIEILGQPDCGGLLLQGWSVHLEPGTFDLGLLCPNLAIHEAAVACFERADLLSTARGLIAFLKTARDVETRKLGRVYFKSQGHYYHLDAVDAPLILEEPQVVAQLKDMLQRLHGPMPVLRALKRVCRPRFAGHETVSALTTPVRLAHDVVLHAPGAGVFVSGWLLDPCKSVSMVLLKSTRNFYARIDQTWARLPRPDVTEGFASNPLFTDHLRSWETRHGFMAFVPRPQPLAADEVHYLEVVMEDESCAFLPLKFNDGDRQAILKQILSGVNVGDPAIDNIVERHLGPLVAALSAGSPSVAATASASFGRYIEHPTLSIVVPLPAGWSDFDINLARFAGDSEFQDVEIIVVAPRATGNAIAQALRRYASFYDVSVELVLSDAPLDYHAALEAGARSARAELLLLLSPAVFPRCRGWLGRLLLEFDRFPDAGALSPTLLYEYDSIRFAGTAGMPNLAAGVLERFRGYGHHWLEGEQAKPVWAGTTECCLVRKQLLSAVGGFSQQFLSSDLKTFDFGLRLQATGSKFYWVPSVTMYALDDDVAEPAEYWSQVRQLVDDWGFERKWSIALPTANAQR